MNEMRDRIAEALTKWTLSGAGMTVNQPRNREIVHANSLLRADVVMSIVQPELDRLAELEAQLAALLDPSWAEKAEQITEDRHAMPKDERIRLDAADAPLLRIQLAHWYRKHTELQAKLDETTKSAALEIWERIGGNSLVEWKHRAEQAEADVTRIREEAERQADRDRIADDLATEHAQALDADVKALIARAESAEAELERLRAWMLYLADRWEGQDFLASYAKALRTALDATTPPPVETPPGEPEISELTCLWQERHIPHERHGWQWKFVERWCPGMPASPAARPSAPRSQPAGGQSDAGEAAEDPEAQEGAETREGAGG